MSIPGKANTAHDPKSTSGASENVLRKKNIVFQEKLTDMFQPVRGRVLLDRESATETVHTGLIPGRVKPKKLVNTASLLDAQH